MLTLPVALIAEKNKLFATGPWLWLLDITLPDASHLRLTRNTEDVTYGGHVYTRFGFLIGEQRSAGDGRAQMLTVTVANPGRALEPYLAAHDGLIGCAVTLVIAHADNLGEDHADLTLAWEILAVEVNAESVQFQLGAESPMRRRYPLYAALPRACGWVFKGAECAYAGTATSCARTLDACRALGNSRRFGGRPGLVSAVRVVTG